MKLAVGNPEALVVRHRPDPVCLVIPMFNPMKPSHNTLDCISGWSVAWETLIAQCHRKCMEVAKGMSMFYDWSKPHPYSGLGILVHCTDFFTESPLPRRLQSKTSRSNNKEEWGPLSHIYYVYRISCMQYYDDHFSFWWWQSMKNTLKNTAIPQLLCISSSFFLFFPLLRKTCKTMAGRGFNLGVVFASFCFCHLLTSLLFPPCPLLSRLLVTSVIAQRPPASAAETVSCRRRLCARPRASESKHKTPKSPSLAPSFSPSAPCLRREHSHFSPRRSSLG